MHFPSLPFLISFLQDSVRQFSFFPLLAAGGTRVCFYPSIFFWVSSNSRDFFFSLLFSSSGDFFSSFIHRVVDMYFASNFTSECVFGKTGRENSFAVVVFFFWV